MMKLRQDYEPSPTIEYPLIAQTVPAYYVYSKSGDDDKCAIEVESYSLELQDTPGRVIVGNGDDDYSLNKGPEKNIGKTLFFSAPQPTPEEYDDWYCDPENPGQRQPLIKKNTTHDASNFRHKDQLLDWRPTMGYVVVFDMLDLSSWMKAVAIVKFLRKQTTPTKLRKQIGALLYLPIYLFGNKSDLCGNMKGDVVPPVLQTAMDWVESTWNLAGKEQNQVSKDDDTGRYNKLRDYGWVDMSRKTSPTGNGQYKHSYVRLCYGDIKHGQVTFYKDSCYATDKWLVRDGPFQLEELFHRLVARMVEQPEYTKQLFTYCFVKDQNFVPPQSAKAGYFDDPVGVEEPESCFARLLMMLGLKSAHRKD